jgi:hypothetical protein
MAKQQGAAAKAADTVFAKTNQLKDATQAVAVSLGNQLLPAWKGILDAANRVLDRMKALVNEFVSGSTFAERLGAAVSGVADRVGAVFEYIAEVIARSTEGFAAMAEEVANLVQDIFGMGEGLANAAEDGKLLNQIFEIMGLGVAAIRDGITFIKGLFFSLMALMSEGLAQLSEAAANLAGKAGFGGLADKLREASAEYRKFGAESQAKSDAVRDAFVRGDTAMANYIRRLEEAKNKVAEGKYTPTEEFKNFDLAISMLTQQFKKGEISSNEFMRITQQLKNEMLQAGMSGKLYSEEVEKLSKKFDGVGDVIKDEVSDALKEMGVSAEQSRGQLDKAVNSAILSFSKYAKSAATTSEEVRKVFDIKITAASSLKEVQAYFAAINDNEVKAKLGEDGFRNALEATKEKWEELFASQLKAANTREKFEQLKKDVQAAGEAGVISGTRMSQAFREVRDAISGAKEEAERLAKAQKAQFDASQGVANAMREVRKAERQEIQATADVEEAMVKYRKEGTAAAKQGVEVAKAQQAVARANVELERRRGQEAIANSQLVYETNEKERIAMALSRDKDNESLRSQLEMQEDRVRSAQQVVQQTSENVAIQQQVTNELADSADEARRIQENLAKAGQEADDIDPSMKKFGESVGAAGYSVGMMNDLLEASGATTADAAKEAERLHAEWMQVTRQLDYGLQEWFQLLNTQAKFYDDMVETGKRMKADREEAERWAAGMERVFSGATSAAEAIVDGAAATQTAVSGSDAWAAAMARVSEQARDAARGAKESALAFMNSVNGIRAQLLRAQGQEQEAIRLNYIGRKQQLAIEERLLEIKIQAAIIQAKAAGLSDAAADLAAYLNQVRQGYRQAVSDLDKLEQIELEQARRAEAERRKSEESQRAEQQKTHDERMDQIKKEKAAYADDGGSTGGGLGLGVGAQPLTGGARGGDPNAGLTAQQRILGGFATGGVGQPGSIANRLLNASAAEIAAGFGGKKPEGENAFFGKPVEKVVKVEFSSGGKKVSAAVNSGDEDALLGLLADAQGTAA